MGLKLHDKHIALLALSIATLKVEKGTDEMEGVANPLLIGDAIAKAPQFMPQLDSRRIEKESIIPHIKQVNKNEYR
jgi:hypothetical protein